ncbi:hypothetical protein AK830_g334 [Neonectria ditissima]|uniref:Pentatricopeptide repeat-containing protein 2, mitochondrial n=1 Tax=Neonectria ditissima TaxID=78410 RepID=A0A0P7BYB4_9HYPO|nr:hypothetical protein AK830_g334 [Neonectria ditissima]
MAESILSCSASLRRAVQQLPPQRVVLERTALLQTRSLLHQTQPRFSSTTPPVDNSPVANPSVASPSQVTASIKAEAPQNLDVNAVDPEEPSVAAKKAKEKLERAVKKNLPYLEDPWKLGQYVNDALAKDRYDEALLLTQKASAKDQVVVSWNHLINYQLEKQQLRNAVKLYNEMKKRAQLPNMQTYSIMFRGFAKSQHPKLAVSEAIRHYQILLKDSRLEPNSIHLNAVLNVCSRAGDLDSMFSIADTINESTRAADSFTYTTIINALRYNLLGDIKDLPDEQKNDNITKAIGRAKTIWEEVIGKWRQGRLVLDEEVVCAMGRLLIMAPDRIQKREVLDLIEQTMNIPNISKAELVSAADFRTKGLARANAKLAHRVAWVKPDRNTLALVLTTLASSKLTTCGIKYWNVLVREHGIQPDMDNWMRMFGMLKVAKASAHACDILEIVPDEYINARNYQIAMETCVRDNINLNAIKNANKALDSMVKRLRVPDPHTMRLFLRVSLVSHYQLRARSEKGDLIGAKRDYGIQITDALARLWEPYRKLHNHYFNVVKPKDDKAQAILYNDKREVIALARIMYGAFNKVIQQGMLPEADLQKIRPVGARINREIHTFFANREELEPNLRKSKGRGTAEEDMSQYEVILGGDFEWDTTQASRPSSGRRERSMGEDRSRSKFGEDKPRSKFGEDRPRSTFREDRSRSRSTFGEDRPKSRFREDRRDSRMSEDKFMSKFSDERRGSRMSEDKPKSKWGKDHSRGGDDKANSRWSDERRESRTGGDRSRPRVGGEGGDGLTSMRRAVSKEHHRPSELSGVRDLGQRRASLPW